MSPVLKIDVEKTRALKVMDRSVSSFMSAWNDHQHFPG